LKWICHTIVLLPQRPKQTTKKQTTTMPITQIQKIARGHLCRKRFAYMRRFCVEGGYNEVMYLLNDAFVQDEEDEEDRQYFKVVDGGNPDVDYFDTLDEAKAFCDQYESLDYGLIMLCDWKKQEIGDWGDFEEV